MASVFVSHSSYDEEIAFRLATDLKSLGHQVWLDKWSIKVGECIVQGIEQGLSDCDYLVLLMSKKSLASGWVEREWSAKYWEEVRAGRTILLPVLLEECKLPALLATKRYANLSTNYAVGLAELAQTLPHVVPTIQYARAEAGDRTTLPKRALPLVALLSDRNTPLSVSLPQVMGVAIECGLSEIAEICRVQIKGPTSYPKTDRDALPEYLQPRVVRLYYARRGELNTKYAGWGGSASAALSHMERDSSNFSWIWRLLDEGVATLEDLASNAPSGDKNLLLGKVPANAIDPEYPDPNHRVTSYMPARTYSDVLRDIRADMIRRIAGLLE